MPRKARIDAPDAIHHVIARGIERRRIFKNDVDRRDFLSRYGKIITETGTRYDAFGQIVEGDLMDNPYALTGKRLDTESGLYHFHFRNYDPETGVWTTADPTSIWGGLNLYQYVSNNPINRVDVWGLEDGDATGGDAGIGGDGDGLSGPGGGTGGPDGGGDSGGGTGGPDPAGMPDPSGSSVGSTGGESPIGAPDPADMPDPAGTSVGSTGLFSSGGFWGALLGFAQAFAGFIGGTIFGAFIAADGINNAAIAMGYQDPNNEMPSMGDVFGDIIGGLNQGLNSGNGTCR